MSTMIDSVTSGAIPKGTPVVAGYVDGPYGPTDPAGWPVAAWHSFPGSELVTITVTGLAGARVYDIETGDGTPQTGAAWAHREIAGGRRPTLYFSQSLWPQITNALERIGVNPNSVDYWIADYVPVKPTHLPDSRVAWQWLANVTVNGHFVDYSITNGVWPGTPAPPPPPTPTPPPAPPVPEGDDMQSTLIEFTTDGQGNAWTSIPAGVTPQNVVNCVAVDADPRTGGYLVTPRFAGVTQANQLVFLGGKPNTLFGFYVQSATPA